DGEVALASTPGLTLPVTWASRSEGTGQTSTPEELLGAAHAACFSMAFAKVLGDEGTPPETIQATAAVTFSQGTGITGSHLLVSATVPGLTSERFAELAEQAKQNCPVSVALAGVTVTLEASLA
ncbi:OsmC family peroxiredoxin, partial [Mycetocola reblochoni]